MLEAYWPSAEQVNACIKNEAETASASVLLAVHQPSLLTTRNVGTNIPAPASEQDLLDAFLTDNTPGGYVLTPITGPSGIGKSHVIRWLDAQLRRSPKSDKLLIIKIPKSASLRRVVELILEPLADDPRYAKSREELTRAISEVDAGEAVVLFRAQLEVALAARAVAFQAEAREHPERGAQLRPLMGHAKSLPQLFSDAALKQHFAEKVLARVIARALLGRSDAAIDDETQSQFFPDDLIIPDDVPLGEAAHAVRTYYQTQLAAGDASRRQRAVDLLNTVVDSAIRNVFQLEQNTGGMTLQDIILGVRKILFEDGRDLVLLIEDFAALAGIQEVLLKVCIQEGEYEGRKVQATMRTALALTDGYLTSRDTILTRAQRVWVVGDRQLTDEEIKSNVVEMAGAYLNAARWGAAAIQERFEDRADSADLSGRDWLPSWHDELQSDEATAALEAFGFSNRGDPLFPFNRSALEQLTNRHLAAGGRLVFKPRTVVNEILRSALLMRPVFERGAFPPTDFQGLRPNGFLAEWTSQSSATDAQKGRLGALLATWGGNAPNQSTLAQVPPALFTTFGLPTPVALANLKHVPKPPEQQTSGPREQTITPQVPPAPSETAAEDPLIVEWNRKLEAWAQDGEMLPQTEARQLRTLLADMLTDAMDWPALRLRKRAIRPTWLSIAGARNNPTVGRVLTVCDQQQDPSGAIRAGFLGAVRFDLHRRRWSYPEADRDYVATAAIVDDLKRQLTPLLLEEARGQAAAVGSALLTQARIAGLAPPIRVSGAAGMLPALFVPLPTPEPTSNEAWDQLRRDTFPPQMREKLQKELFDRVASFQGTGAQAFAVDTARLTEALSSSDGAANGLPEELPPFIASVGTSRLWNRLSPLIARLLGFQNEIAEFIDDTFDKAMFVADLRDVALLLQATGVWPHSLKLAEFEQRVTEFQSSAIVDLIEKLATITGENDREQTPRLLNALGALDLNLIQRTAAFLATTKELFDLAEPRVAQLERSHGQANPEVVADELIDLLTVMVGDEPPTSEAAA
ncbi:protein DpdH [Roseococcus sp.]|uniref:protein DpdH n=1 Tax=Roseococcus sp. TaxID=2109646 RepID=UPI003BAC3712